MTDSQVPVTCMYLVVSNVFTVSDVLIFKNAINLLMTSFSRSINKLFTVKEIGQIEMLCS